MANDFNGVDVHQYDQSIVLSAERYIDRVMVSHGWEKSTDTDKYSVPLSPTSLETLYKHVGPPEGTPEAATLSRKHGFAFRGLLGELLYAYTTCCPDIGYAVVTLSKFSTCPYDVHYSLLKRVANSLHETKHWGIT